MHLSSPVRIPKLQLAAEQPTTGKCLTPPKKKRLPHIQGKRGTLHKMGRGAKLPLESNPYYPEMLGGIKQKLVQANNAVNKASVGDEVPVELFQNPKRGCC